MRPLVILLLSTCLASGAFAQAGGPGSAGAVNGLTGTNSSSNSAAANTVPAMVNGKYTVGYEGRGDYVKNDKLKRHLPATASSSSAPSTSNSASTSSKPAANSTTASTQDTKATAAANTSASPFDGMLSDSALLSDTPTPKVAVMPSTMSNTNSNTHTSSTSPTQSNPMVLVGGKLVPMH